MRRSLVRRMRAHGGFGPAIALIVTCGVVAFGVGVLAGSRDVSAGSSPGWTTYTDPNDGFSVQFPSAWHRAESPLVPNLESPGEILSVGTGRMEVGGGGNCGLYPVEAVAEMRPRDVLISLKEWGMGRPDLGAAPGRPARFRIQSRPSEPLSLNVAHQINRWNLDEGGNRIRWTDFEFRDRGRVFRGFVAIGEAASQEARNHVLQTLDSLQFEREET